MVIYLQEPTETDAFRKIEAETGAKQGKGTKYQYMVLVKQCFESMNVADMTKQTRQVDPNFLCLPVTKTYK